MSLVSFWTGSVLDLARWGVEVGVVPDPLYLGNILFLLGVFSPVTLLARFDLGVFGAEARDASLDFLFTAFDVRLVIMAEILDLTPSFSFSLSFLLIISPDPLLVFVAFFGLPDLWQSTLLLILRFFLAGEGAVEMFLVILVLEPVSEEEDLSVSLFIDKLDRDPVIMSEFLLDLVVLLGLVMVLLFTGVLFLTELGLSRVVPADFPRCVVLSDGLPTGRFDPRPVLLMAAFERALGPVSRFGREVLPSTGFLVVFLVGGGGLVGVGVVLGATGDSSGIGVLLSCFGDVGEITMLGSLSSNVIFLTFGS